MVKLPDGSGCFTAEIMSKEEAMKLPPNKRPICFRISSRMYHDTFQAIGAASMTFNKDAGNEVFNSEAASKIAVDLCFVIAEEIEKVTEARDKLRTALCQLCGVNTKAEMDGMVDVLNAMPDSDNKLAAMLALKVLRETE